MSARDRLAELAGDPLRTLMLAELGAKCLEQMTGAGCGQRHASALPLSDIGTQAVHFQAIYRAACSLGLLEDPKEAAR